MSEISQTLHTVTVETDWELSRVLVALRAVAAGSPFEPSDKTATIAIDTENGGNLVYNDAFMADRTKGEFRYLVMFIGLMIPYATPECLAGRDYKLWERAANYVINADLAALGFGQDMPFS